MNDIQEKIMYLAARVASLDLQQEAKENWFELVFKEEFMGLQSLIKEKINAR